MRAAWSQAEETCQVLIVSEQDIVLAGLRTLLVESPGFGERCDIICIKSPEDDLLPLYDAFDLILLDAGHGSESDILSKVLHLRARTPAAALVVFADSSSPELIRNVMNERVAGFVPSTTTASVIAGALDLVLRGGTYLPPQLLDNPLPPPARPLSGAALQSMIEHGLTPRQRAVLGLLLEGRSNKEIARELGVTLGTVKNYVSALLKAMHAKTRSHVLASVQSRPESPRQDATEEESNLG